jgi:hypothetical protein
MSDDSLWGDLNDLETIRTPREILREQAIHLTESTNGVLSVDVVDTMHSATVFYHDFDLVVPLLNNYRYTLLSVSYPVLFYPLTVRSEHLKGPKGRVEQCDDEEEFRNCLKSIFTSREVRDILVRLKSQAIR